MSKTDTHPAKFTGGILGVADKLLRECWPWEWASAPKVLDPFAGTGRIHELQALGYETCGVEIEPEFAAWHPDTLVGDATRLTPSWSEFFDAIVTSPCYGNRFADFDMRPTCAGTYAKSLGRRPSKGSAGGMQWGNAYRDLHTRAWSECFRVLQPGGALVINIKDHYRGKQLQRVPEWHFAMLGALGFKPGPRTTVEVPGLKVGANTEYRVDYEHVAAFVKP